MNWKAVLISGLTAIFIGTHGASASEVVEHVLNDDGSGYTVIYNEPDPYDVQIPVCIMDELVWPQLYSPPHPPPINCELTTPISVWFMLVIGVAMGGIIAIVFFARARSGKYAAGRG
ncbi:MAG: hypothetical protein J4G04_03480 [Nitrosopumilaceae archaeon]|nr:hypothetical protein [Nitrosopumilaceae archaeon]